MFSIWLRPLFPSHRVPCVPFHHTWTALCPSSCTYSVLVYFRPYQLGLASAPTPVHSSLVSAIFSLDLTNGRPRLPFYKLLNIPDRDKLWRRGDTFVNREVWETTWCPLQLGNILLWAWESLVRLLLSFFSKAVSKSQFCFCGFSAYKRVYTGSVAFW